MEAHKLAGASKILREKLQEVVAEGPEKTGGFGFHMWACLVDRDNRVVCMVYSGPTRDSQMPVGRVIAAQKAHTANCLSQKVFSVSSCNMYAASQPGAPLWGYGETHPIDTSVAYGGDVDKYGQGEEDPMVGKRMGGMCMFGGGLSLYDENGDCVGGLGLSGDSCVSDHIIAWKLRNKLMLDYVPAGPSPTGDDNMANDFEEGKSKSGWGHPETSPLAKEIVASLPTIHPISKK
jgi:uncharacterized protein GlcG (DUF336 family)